jgi:hypothetical protein
MMNSVILLVLPSCIRPILSRLRCTLPVLSDLHICAVSKPWAFGKTLDMGWGSEKVLACKDKWMFYFKVDSNSTETGIDRNNHRT